MFFTGKTVLFAFTAGVGTGIYLAKKERNSRIIKTWDENYDKAATKSKEWKDLAVEKWKNFSDKNPK